MQTLFEVHGDHTISKRIDEYRMTEIESNDLMAELAGHGYENLMRYSDLFLEDGDTVFITGKMYDDASKMAKEQVDYMFKKPFPIKGKVKTERVNRFSGQLIIEWENMSDDWGAGNTTNTQWLSHEDHGFEIRFIQPELEELEIINCADKYLFESELVEKYYALQNRISIEEAQEVINKVQSAMSRSQIVFYRP
jgi:hypothetical protein